MSADVPASVLPTISIVTISFNQAPYLGECLRSVHEQRGPGVEYIVVDPGSTDGSRDLIAAHSDGIDRALLEPDDGPADGLNRGFAEATGEIFGYINADDRLAPGALAFVRAYFATHPDVDVLCGAIRIIDRDGRAASRARTADRFDLKRYAAGVCTVGQQGTFFRASAFRDAGGFNRANRINWDGELLVDLALAGARFETVDRVLGDFRIYTESITGSNKHYHRLLAEHDRIARKIAGREIVLYTPAQTRIHRWLYRFNPSRHARYLLVR